MTEPRREGNTRKFIAELHAAGYSNAKIGYLLAEHGARKPRSEATVRSWAMGNAEPRASDFDALQSLHASAMGIASVAENYDVSSAETP